MCAKNHLLIFSSFQDIWENVEWPRFFWTTRYVYTYLRCDSIVANTICKRNLKRTKITKKNMTAYSKSVKIPFYVTLYHRPIYRLLGRRAATRVTCSSTSKVQQFHTHTHGRRSGRNSGRRLLFHPSLPYPPSLPLSSPFPPPRLFPGRWTLSGLSRHVSEHSRLLN